MTPKERFHGVGPALVTPMDAAGNPDLEAFTRHVERMLEGGVDFLVPCGTTGESATLTPAEQRAVIERAVQVAAGAVPVLAGAGSNSTTTAVALAQAARDAGAEGVLVVTPYYNKPSPDGLVLHYKAVSRVGLPVILYNVPGRTGANVPPAVILRVAEETRAGDVPGVVGVKESSGDLTPLMELVAKAPGGFTVLSGDDHLALAVAACGGHGLISVVANEDPGGTAAIDQLVCDGKLDEARREHYRLLPLMHANFLESNPGPVKAALSIMGHMDDHLRAPLAPVRPETRAALRKALEHAELLG
ncbi:MAG TPA: 4-hydroxy-tetrahydrodipicolinate synthase [Longimicrobiales bacterium]|nr:4-hydroxy-tetrahydrodipicolinate synthase [Longimicrobiales bacterium]